MNRRRELTLVVALLLLAVVLRVWDLSRLPPGFNDDELAHIRITETVRGGNIAVYYQVGDGRGRAAVYAVANMLATELVGTGLFGYRVLSLWGGLISLAVLYRLARRLFGAPAALVALGAMTVNLRAALLARTATPEPFVPLLTLLALWGLVVAFNVRQDVRYRMPQTLPFAMLAVIFGLSGYLHFTALVLGPLGGLFFAHLLITRQPLSRRVWSAAVFVIVLTTVIAVPYLISTLRDPRASELYVLWSERPQSATDVVDGALRAISAVIWRGDVRVVENLPSKPLLGPVMALLLVLGAVEALRRWRQPRYALMLFTLGAGLLTDLWVGVDATFSANLVALPAVFILPGIGALTVWRSLRARGVEAAWQPVALLLAAMLATNILLVRERLFDDWRSHPQVAEAYHANLGYLAAYLDRTPDGLPVSLCAAYLHEPHAAGLSPRQILRVMMHRDDMDLRHSDCRAGLVFPNGGAPMRFVFMDAADRQLMPPELTDWLVGSQPIAVDGLPVGAVLRVDVEQRIRDAGGYWDSFSPAYFMPSATRDKQRVKLPVPLEQNLTFAGYEPRVLNSKPVPGGDPIVLVTYWRVDGKLPDELGIFAHLLAYPEGDQAVPLLEPWAESNTIDVIPAELKNRDLFAQVSYLWLSDSVKPGTYALTVGAYTVSASVLDNHLNVMHDGQSQGDRLLLGDIAVRPGP